VVSVVYTLTEPVLRPLRGIIPPVRMGAVGFDLSPIIVFVALGILQRSIC
jgi:YggT family protein